MKKLLILLPILMMTAACSTIYFHNRGEESEASLDNSKWHHDGVYGLVEFSDPKNMKALCDENPWDTIQVQQSFLNGLAQAFTWHLYNPWTVSYACLEDSDHTAVKKKPKFKKPIEE